MMQVQMLLNLMHCSLIWEQFTVHWLLIWRSTQIEIHISIHIYREDGDMGRGQFQALNPVQVNLSEDIRKAEAALLSRKFNKNSDKLNKNFHHYISNDPFYFSQSY